MKVAGHVSVLVSVPFTAVATPPSGRGWRHRRDRAVRDRPDVIAGLRRHPDVGDRDGPDELREPDTRSPWVDVVHVHGVVVAGGCHHAEVIKARHGPVLVIVPKTSVTGPG